MISKQWKPNVFSKKWQNYNLISSWRKFLR